MDTESPQPIRGVVREAGISFFPLALIARLPFAMLVVGVLTLVVSARGSLQLGGMTSAMVGIGTAAFGAFLGMAADRFGQRPVLLVAGIANSLALFAMAWVVYTPAPDSAVLAIAFMIGATAPQASPMSRTRLAGIVTRVVPIQSRGRAINTAMAYESAADEAVFVFGPFIVGVIGSLISPAAPVWAAGALTLFFVTAFALHHTARTPKASATHPAEGAVVQAPFRELLHPQLLILVLAVFGIGGFFGATLSSLTSSMNDAGAPERAGLLYGVMGVSSAALALGVAALPARFSLNARCLTFAPILAVGAVSFQFVNSDLAVAGALLLAGAGIGPTFVSLFGLAVVRSPAGRSNTVMTVLSSTVQVGQAFTAALTGALAENLGTDAAWASVLIPVGILLVAVGVNAVFFRQAPEEVRPADLVGGP